jgi:hypothetical protein
VFHLGTRTQRTLCDGVPLCALEWVTCVTEPPASPLKHAVQERISTVDSAVRDRSSIASAELAATPAISAAPLPLAAAE